MVAEAAARYAAHPRRAPGESRPLPIEIPAAEVGLQLTFESWNATGAIGMLQAADAG